MPIRVVCECGSKLDAPDSLAGQQARCGNCGVVLTIKAAPQTNDDDPDAPRLPPKVNRKKKKSRVFREHAGSEDDDSATKAKRQKRSSEQDADRSRTSLSLLEVWTNGLTFPFRREAFIMVAVVSVLYGPFAAALSMRPGIIIAGAYALKFVLGFFTVAILVVGYFCFFLLQTLRATAQNEQDLPLAAAFDFEEVRSDLWLMAGATGVNFLPFIAMKLLFWLDGRPVPDALSSPTLYLCLFLWPMAVVATALQSTVLAANHWMTIRSVLRMPLEYTATLGVAGGMIAAVIALDWALPNLSIANVWLRFGAHLVRGFISWWLLFMSVTACMSLMGFLYYRNRRKIGWFRDSHPRY